MASDGKTPPKQRRFRSRDWFDDPKHLDMVALYLERFMNYGLTANELLSGKPIIGIAQTGGDLTPCNRVHLDTVKRVREGIRDAGGVPMEFPLHPIFENCRRPTAALDRNLAYLGLVEILHGYPIDAVPIVLQWPSDGADAAAASRNCFSLIWPAASLRRERQMTVPDPTRSPSCQPSSIGPPESTMAGISTVDAAMICAGVVLSHPVVSTTASIG